MVQSFKASANIICDVSNYMDEDRSNTYEIREKSIPDESSARFQENLQSMSQMVQEEIGSKYFQYKNVKIDDVTIDQTPKSNGDLEGTVRIRFEAEDKNTIQEKDFDYIAEALLDMIASDIIIDIVIPGGSIDEWGDSEYQESEIEFAHYEDGSLNLKVLTSLEETSEITNKKVEKKSSLSNKANIRHAYHPFDYDDTFHNVWIPRDPDIDDTPFYYDDELVADTNLDDYNMGTTRNGKFVDLDKYFRDGKKQW